MSRVVIWSVWGGLGPHPPRDTHSRPCASGDERCAGPARSAGNLSRIGSVDDEDLLDLADRLRADGDDVLPDRLEVAYYRDARLIMLSRPDRDAILVALTDCPDGFNELRGKLEGDLAGLLN